MKQSAFVLLTLLLSALPQPADAIWIWFQALICWIPILNSIGFLCPETLVGTQITFEIRLTGTADAPSEAFETGCVSWLASTYGDALTNPTCVVQSRRRLRGLQAPFDDVVATASGQAASSNLLATLVADLNMDAVGFAMALSANDAEFAGVTVAAIDSGGTFPTMAPTENPTPIPTAPPTPSPTQMPTPSPTKMPTPSPTQMPTPAPTLACRQIVISVVSGANAGGITSVTVAASSLASLFFPPTVAEGEFPENFLIYNLQFDTAPGEFIINSIDIAYMRDGTGRLNSVTGVASGNFGPQLGNVVFRYTKTYSYDAENKLERTVQVQTSPLSPNLYAETKDFMYFSDGKLQQISVVRPNTPMATIVDLTYDSVIDSELPSTITTTTDGVVSKKETWVFNPDGSLFRQLIDSNGDGTDDEVLEHEYDGLGRLTATKEDTDNDGTFDFATIAEYDGDNTIPFQTRNDTDFDPSTPNPVFSTNLITPTACP